MQARVGLLALGLALSWGCESAGPGPDAGSDAAARDRAEPDAEPRDGAPELPDAETADGGLEDATPLDADAGDAETPWGPVRVDITVAQPPARLSDFRFFQLRDGVPHYNEGVEPYELNTPLFSDYALKWRAVYVPPGQTIQFQPVDAFDFPVGSAIVKSFGLAPDLRTPDLDVRIIETRVLVRYPEGWRAFPYLWRSDLSDADYHARGAVLPLSFVDPRGQPRVAQYLVPQRVQCLACHEQIAEDGSAFLALLGPKARYLHRDFAYPEGSQNQLTRWAARGWLEDLPALEQLEAAFDFGSLSVTGTRALDAAAIERAARDYLDINCAHCHNPRATQGVTSQLFLGFDNEDTFRLGVCKEPGSAGSGSGGLRFDIVPGDAEASILLYRTASETAGEMMPLIGRSLRDDLGVELLRAWIDGMPAQSCD